MFHMHDHIQFSNRSVEWAFPTCPRWRNLHSGGKCHFQCHAASTSGDQYLSSDPRDCSIFIWYEFTKPKSSRVLKASYWQYLQIVDTISQMSLRVTQGHFWQLQPIPTMENITPSCHILKETDFYSLSASSVCGSQRVLLVSRNSLCTDKPEERITSFLQNKIGINNIEVEINLNKYFSKFIINYWLSNIYSSGI